MKRFEVITDAQTGEQATRELTPEEIAALAPTEDRVREQRNAFLSASDWTQVADAPVDQTAWAEYRQALRDVPKQEGFPANVIWPIVP